MSDRGNLTRRLHAKWRRTVDWEFWPPFLFYLPVAWKIFTLAIRHAGIRIPFYTNPGTINGFQAGESKAFSLGRLHPHAPEFVAQTWLVEGDSSVEKIAHVEQLQEQNDILYPFILKPDCGNRGSGVKVIRNDEDRTAYLSAIRAPTILQRFIPGPHEAGIFYYRYPDQQVGQLFAITEKVFPKVTGDGERTLEELIWADDRAFIIADKYCERFADQLQTIVEAGVDWPLVNAGNHAQGCIFYDGWRMATPELTQRFDDIAKGLPGFYFGRFDARYESEEDLKAGLNFQILEVNGFASEATSIYDPKYSVIDAYKTLFKQWEIVFEIGSQNRDRNESAPSFSQLLERARRYREQKESHPSAD